MHSLLHSKLLSALGLSSFAGEGLPERMRSISFALLGLTAAAGLALVAIFAQPGFTLLSPAPLPDQPSAGEAVAAARRLPPERRLASLGAAEPASRQRAGKATAGAPSEVPADRPEGGGGGSTTDAAVGAPAPAGTIATPEVPSEGKQGSGGGGGNETGDAPAPDAPEQAASPAPNPVAVPQPPAPAPPATTWAPKPAPAPAPGNSASPAAADHASERGIEASAGAPASSGATAAAVAPEPSASPGNGLAKGHEK